MISTESTEDAYTWQGWEAEIDLGNVDDRVGAYFLTIVDPAGEELAIIVHRTCDGKFPLDGHAAKRKETNAATIVAALNEHQRQREAVALHLATD